MNASEAMSAPARRPTATVLVGALLLLLAAGLPGPARAQAAPATVHRCEVGDRVVFQQAPCAPGQAGRVVVVPPANVVSAPATAPPRPPASAPSGGAGTPVAAASAPAVPPPLTDEQACLAYLKPLLRDPASGRILTAKRDGRVLNVQLQAADMRGRLHTRDAACEFVNGRVDDGWSRIQLKRLGWFAPPVWVQGSSPEARRAARAREQSIEALP
jgi:hypothetical protein